MLVHRPPCSLCPGGCLAVHVPAGARQGGRAPRFPGRRGRSSGSQSRTLRTPALDRGPQTLSPLPAWTALRGPQRPHPPRPPAGRGHARAGRPPHRGPSPRAPCRAGPAATAAISPAQPPVTGTFVSTLELLQGATPRPHMTQPHLPPCAPASLRDPGATRRGKSQHPLVHPARGVRKACWDLESGYPRLPPRPRESRELATGVALPGVQRPGPQGLPGWGRTLSGISNMTHQVPWSTLPSCCDNPNCQWAPPNVPWAPAALIVSPGPSDARGTQNMLDLSQQLQGLPTISASPGKGLGGDTCLPGPGPPNPVRGAPLPQPPAPPLQGQ